MNRLQPVSRIGKRAADDYAHRVIQVAALHFFFYVDRTPVCRFSHSSILSYEKARQTSVCRECLIQRSARDKLKLSDIAPRFSARNALSRQSRRWSTFARTLLHHRSTTPPSRSSLSR